MDTQYNFNGRVAVVTGGASGIGATIAEQLRSAGATVVIWDMQAENTAYSAKVDISDDAQIADATKALLAHHTKLDFLINSAGFTGPTMPLTEYAIDMWQRIIDVNLVGTFKVCRALVPLMQDNGYGRIVNLASLAGKEGTPNASAYSAAKGGVIAMTKSLGKELAQSEIRVNCVAPAAVDTAILQQMSPEHVQIMIDKSPMQRLGEVEEVAQLAMWLCSGACTFNTGAVFDLSGGRATY